MSQEEGLPLTMDALGDEAAYGSGSTSFGVAVARDASPNQESNGPSASRSGFNPGVSTDVPRSDDEFSRWGTVIPPGATLAGRYRIDWFIARGGMGEVYAAFDRELGDRIALKTMNSALAGDPEGLAALKAEVSLARKVSHSNVCRIHDLGAHSVAGYPNLMFLTMEFVEGESLASRLRREGPLPEHEAVQFAAGILSGLAAAHEASVLHRDLKSDNIMLRKRMGALATPVIMDFGLASALNPNSSRISGDQALVGSLGYMAPEQVQGDVLRAVTDVYSLGVILFEMLTGRLPFLASTPALAALKRLHERPPRVRSINPDLSLEVERIVERALQPRPHDRYNSALAMLSDLEALPYYRRSTPPSPATVRGVGPIPDSVRSTTPSSATLDQLVAAIDLAIVGPVDERRALAAADDHSGGPVSWDENSRRGLDVTLRSPRTLGTAFKGETSSRPVLLTHEFKASEPTANTSLPALVAPAPVSRQYPRKRWTVAMVTGGGLLGGVLWLASTSAQKSIDDLPVGRVSIGSETYRHVTPVTVTRPLATAEPHMDEATSGRIDLGEEKREAVVDSPKEAPANIVRKSDIPPAQNAQRPTVEPSRLAAGLRAPLRSNTAVSRKSSDKPLEGTLPEGEPAKSAAAQNKAGPPKRPTIAYPPELRPKRLSEASGSASPAQAD